MGFLSRRKRDPERAEAEAQARSLEQETGSKIDVVPREEMTEHAWRFAEKIAVLYPDDLPERVMVALQVSARTIFGPDREFSSDAYRWAMSLSKFGYVTRVVEEVDLKADPRVLSFSEALERARANPSWQDHDWGAIVNRFAGEMAAETDDPFQASWSIPGPGGDFRAEVVRAILEVMLDDNRPPEDLSPPEWTRCWTFGFLFRCAEGSLPEGAAI